MTACSLHRKDKEKKIALHTYQPDLLHFRKITYEFNPNKKKKAQVRTFEALIQETDSTCTGCIPINNATPKAIRYIFVLFSRLLKSNKLLIKLKANSTHPK